LTWIMGALNGEEDHRALMRAILNRAREMPKETFAHRKR
jgi:hypothetical protein